MTPLSDILLRVLPGRIRGLRWVNDEAVLFEVPLTDDTLTPNTADEVHHCLHEPSRLILTLPTAWTLTGTVDLEHISTTHRRQQLLFKLEALLPFAAEDVVADFIVGSDAAWGVVVRHGPLARFLKRLEHHGHHVLWIVPETLLVFANAPPNTLWLLVKNDVLEWLAYDDHGPRTWRRLPLDPVAVRAQLDHLPKSFTPSTIELINAPDHFSQTWLATQPENQITELQTLDVESVLLDHAQAVFAEKLQPPVQLARHQLAPSDRWVFLKRPLKLAFASLILCLVCLCASLLVRAHQYDTLTNSHRQQLIDLYQQTLGTDQPPPSGIRLRLASQLRMAQALRSTPGPGIARNGEPPHTSNPRLSGENGRLSDLTDFNTLTIIYACLKQLPSDQRLLLLEIRVDADRIILTGQSRSHGEAGRLVQTLNRNPQLLFDDPRTRNLRNAQGVSFTTSGRYLPPNHLKPFANPDGSTKVAAATKSAIEEASP